MERNDAGVVGRVGSCIVNFMICMPCLKATVLVLLVCCAFVEERPPGLMCFCISSSRESGTFSNLDWGQLYESGSLDLSIYV